MRDKKRKMKNKKLNFLFFKLWANKKRRITYKVKYISKLM